MTDANCSVKVAIRIRPLVSTELGRGCKDIIEVFPEVNQVRLKDSDKAFTYNYVFGPNAGQEDLYNTCIKPIMPNLFKGYNITLLAYGQTGSGKTHSMGTCYNGESDKGVIPRSIDEIFEFIKDNFSYDYTITVSFVELYQEVLYDLLSDRPRDQCTLEIREDLAKGIHIPGVTERLVETSREIMDCLSAGSLKRATSSTFMNTQSSRSHAIFTLHLGMQNKNNRDENKMARLHFVDLAGSERSKKTGAVGTTFKEGVNINKGLFALGNVICALGDDKEQKFVQYRDSNLTRLLKDSLGGNSITLMIACISPADYNMEETVSTLRYADKAKKIKNKPIVNQDEKAALICSLRKEIKTLQLQLIGQGGPISSPAEVELLKKESSDLKQKLRSANFQLVTSVNHKSTLMESNIVLQNLLEKYEGIKPQLDERINAIEALANGGGDADETLKMCAEIRNIFGYVCGESTRSAQELKKRDDLMVNGTEYSESHSVEINDEQETHANRQLRLHDELQQLTNQMVLKERLANEMESNVRYIVDHQLIMDTEAKVQVLEKEKTELLQQAKSGHTFQIGTNKIAEQRRKRIQDLESQIQGLKKKVTELNKLVKLKERDELKIQQLRRDIGQMKQAKVKLVKSMRDEAEKFRVWKLQREKELSKWKNEDMKKKNQIVKMQAMHAKQQNVLKRKVEEAAAVNKRLKDALALRKTANEQKFQGRLDKVGAWLKQELDVLFGIVEIEVRLEGLIDDRATLQTELIEMRNQSDVDPTKIKLLEDDIELRSVQIQDIQQKVMDSDEELKNRIKFENIQTMSEAKFALNCILDESLQIKKKECSLSIELEGEIQSGKEKQMSRDEYQRKLIELEKEYEEKVSILLRQCRVTEDKNVSGSDIEKTNQMLMEELTNKDNLIEQLQKQVLDLQNLMCQLQEKWDKLENRSPVNASAGNITFRKHDNLTVTHLEEDDDIKTPPKKIRTKINNFLHVTPETPVRDRDDYDDIERDPDWRLTPFGKRVLHERRAIRESELPKSFPKASFSDLEEKVKTATKRSSDGGCACTKNCTRRCGCKKLNNACTESCKCSSEICQNRILLLEMPTEKENTVAPTEFKKPRLIN